MDVIGLSGYLLASIAFFVFILLLIAARNSTYSGRLLFGAVVMTLMASSLASWQIYDGASLKYTLLVENAKYFLWLVLTISTCFGVFSWQSLRANNQVLQLSSAVFAISVLAWLAAIYTVDGSQYLFFLFLILSLATVVALEQLYRNADAKGKWAIWPLVIAVGTSAVFDFVIFAQAAMVNQLNFEFWYARGYLITLGMPLLLVSARRMKNWSVDVFISRDVVFFSSMLLISGIYLLVLAMAGYAIKLIGGQWGTVLSIAFLALGGTVLATLLITEKLRREVKVFITKHFFANKYDYRVEWLKSIEQLEVGGTANSYLTATEIICQSINASGGVLIKQKGGQHFKSVGHLNSSFSLNHTRKLEPLCQFFEQTPWIIDVKELVYVENSYPDLTFDVEFAKENNIDLVIPVYTGKHLYGMFLIQLPKGRKGYLNWEDRDLLFAVTRQLSIYLSLNEANSELAESKQFEAFHRMSAFLVHDLKNVQGQLALISSNAARHRDNPEFIDDVFETIESATSRLSKVLNQLRNKQSTELHTDKKVINLNELLKSVAEQRNISLPRVDVEIEEDLSLIIEQQDFFSVLNHIVQNAQEATDDNGWVKIQASKDNNIIRIAVVDNGAGMSQDFIENRLFKPFDTTKGNAGMGIGVYEAKQFIEGHGGHIQVTSFEGEGTIFQLTLPSN